MARKPKTDSAKPADTKTPVVRFKIDEQAKTDKPAMSLDNLTDGVRGNLLRKSVKPQTIRKDLRKRYDKSKIAFNATSYSGQIDNVEVKGWQRLSEGEERQIAQVDPYISAIISTRCSQGSICGRPSNSKFDKGSRIKEKKPLRQDAFDTIEQFEAERGRRQREMDAIMRWVLKCGTDNKDIINAAFAGEDKTFKFCSLPEFVAAQIRNLLTFGRCASQVFRNEDGVPVMFRPAPVETIFNVIDGKEINLANSEETAEQSKEDALAYNAMNPDQRPKAYVQRIDGRNVNDWTEDDMKIWYFQKQALFDLNGYPLSPIELAIYMVFIHQNTLGYLRNQFIKGLATKGILCIESTDPAAQLADEDVEQLRRDFHNFATRTDNSAAVPVISGPVKVNYVPLSTAPKDMEFLQIEEHVVRALCSSFQVSPQEMGYGHLSIGQGGINQANKQEEIVRGEERGLRMILDTIFDGLNEIVYENFPEAKDKYELIYVGVGEDTRDAVVARQQQELQTTATMSSLWSDSEKTDTIPFCGNVPLSPLFHANIVPKMKYSEYREYFCGEEGALKNPAYDFLMDPGLNEAYQALKVQPLEMQQAGAALQLEGEKVQIEQAEAQAGQPAGQPGQEPAPQGQPAEQTEPAAKSLADDYRERSRLAKSVGTYLGAWVDAHQS